MMKKKSIVEICAILAIAIAVAAAGCLNAEQKDELKNAAHQAIVFPTRVGVFPLPRCAKALARESSPRPWG